MLRILAVSSGGGHLVEMRRITPAFGGCDLAFATTDREADVDLAAYRHYTIRNVSRRDPPIAIIAAIWQMMIILLKERPDIVVTTGAAPGLIALTLAKLFHRSRTVWIDSSAQAERMSLSGRLVRPVADVWLTQWEHLARPEGPEYWGAVL